VDVKLTGTYKKWFKNLRDQRAKARIAIRIKRLSEGNPGDVKPVGQGVSELRISYGPGYRVYFTQPDKEVILLLVGGDKSSQDVDVARAKELASNR